MAWFTLCAKFFQASNCWVPAVYLLNNSYLTLWYWNEQIPTPQQSWPGVAFYSKCFHCRFKEYSKGVWLRGIFCWPYQDFKEISFSLPLPLMMLSCYLSVPPSDAPASQPLKLVALFQARFALRLWVIAMAVLHFNRRYNLQVPIFPNTKTLISP